MVVDREAEVAGQWLDCLIRAIARAIGLVVLRDDEANVVAARCAKDVANTLSALITLGTEPS